jgi:hypothetical protein
MRISGVHGMVRYITRAQHAERVRNAEQLRSHTVWGVSNI